METRLPLLFWFNTAEAEQAPRPLPVLAEIPARVQALDNPLPRAPEAELGQADRAGPANERLRDLGKFMAGGLHE